MWIWIAIGAGVLALAHTAPAPFLFDVIAGDRSIWHMPKGTPPTVYLTFDDGPNPTTTPDLLDLLAREGVHATFFLIDRHITDVTAPLVRRMFADGHAVALHSHTRADMLMSADTFAHTLIAHADHIERVALGLELVPPAHRRFDRESRRTPYLERGHRRHARRRRVGAARGSASDGRRDGAARPRAARERIRLRNRLSVEGVSYAAAQTSERIAPCFSREPPRSLSSS